MYSRGNSVVGYVRQLLVRRFSDDSGKLKGNRFGIIGVPFQAGQSKDGPAKGPNAIREGGLLKELQSISEHIDVRDYGNIEYQKADLRGRATANMNRFEDVIGCTKKLSDKTYEVLSDNRICLTLGGDHAIGVGSIDGHLRYNKDIAVIWVDAHADLNTNATSTTGNVHGMPVALLCKELADYWPYLPGMDWQKPVISIKNIVYIGLRAVDSMERFIIDKFGIKAFGMREIEVYGIKEVFRLALQHIDPENSKSIHVSFDIDALDALEAPSTGTCVRGGLTLREGIYIMEEVHQTGRLAAVDLVEVNPAIGSPSDVAKTVSAANILLKAVCGHDRRGDMPESSRSIEITATPFTPPFTSTTQN